MPRWSLLLLTSLAVTAACGSKKERPPLPPPPKADMCKSIAAETIQLARGMVRALKGKDVKPEDYDKLDRDEKDLLDKCMGWSDEAVTCAYKKDESARCKEVLSEISGEMAGLPPTAPAGPEVLWDERLPNPPEAVAATGGGAAVAVTLDALVALRKDNPWSKPGVFERWVVVAGNAAFASPVDSGEVVAFDTSTGAELYRAKLPSSPLALRPIAATLDATAIAMATLDGRVLRLDTTLCAQRKGVDCVAPLGAKPTANAFAAETKITRLDDGRFVLRDYQSVRVVGRNGAVETTWKMWDLAGGATPVGTDVVAQMDGRITRIAPSACGNAEFVVTPPPASGERCKGCVDAPAGCATWTWTGNDPEFLAPSALSDGRVAVVASEGLAILAKDGSVVWQKNLGATGPVAQRGGDLFFLCWAKGDEPIGVCAADATTGALQWRTELSGHQNLSYKMYELKVEIVGSSLFVAFGPQLAMLALP